MNREALFCDGTSSYVLPEEPSANETVTLRFRTGRDDVTSVKVLTETDALPMQKEQAKGEFDYYGAEVSLGEEPFFYLFEIQKEDETCYYNRYGVCDSDDFTDAFRILPGFSTPDWAKGAVMYQIFVDRFFNGNSDNDVLDREYFYLGRPTVQVKDWNQIPEEMDVGTFYGGDLEGVLKKLDYLKEMGIEAVYFNPLFLSPSNHKYDCQDYEHIDPHFGRIVRDGGSVLPEGETDNLKATKYRQRVTDEENLKASDELFAQLVTEMHERGIRVIIDGVFNHCGSFHYWMDRERIYEGLDSYEPGAYVSGDSPYRDFFQIQGEDAEGMRYEGWWDHETLPKLNYEASRELEDAIIQVGKKWVSAPYLVDGWRLDVAADLGETKEYNHHFWKRFRREIKSIRPDILILAEHYGDPGEWLQGDEWDSVMNYDAFMDPISLFFTGMEKHGDAFYPELMGNADAFAETVTRRMADMPSPSLQTAMNELSNHDHSRFLTRTNHVTGRVSTLGCEAAEEGVSLSVMREATAVQFTWPGAPTLYYGDEAGVCGFTDPDNRRPYPWGRENQELLSFCREMIRIHKEMEVCRTGSWRMLAWGQDMISYGRFKEDSQLIVVVNHSEERSQVTVPVWMAEVPFSGKMIRLMYTFEEGYTTEPDDYLVEDGELVVNMGKHSLLILKSAEIGKEKERES